MGKSIVCAIWLLAVATADAAAMVGPVTGATIGAKPPVKPVSIVKPAPPNVKPVSYRPITRPTGAPVNISQAGYQDVQVKSLTSSTAGATNDNSKTTLDHVTSDTTTGSITGSESSLKTSSAEPEASDDDRDGMTSTTTSEDKPVTENSANDSGNVEATGVAQSAAVPTRAMSSQFGFITLGAVLVSAIATFVR